MARKNEFDPVTDQAPERPDANPLVDDMIDDPGPGMGREVKIGLAVVLLLLGGLGYVAYDRFVASASGDKQTADGSDAGAEGESGASSPAENPPTPPTASTITAHPTSAPSYEVASRLPPSAPLVGTASASEEETAQSDAGPPFNFMPPAPSSSPEVSASEPMPEATSNPPEPVAPYTPPGQPLDPFSASPAPGDSAAAPSKESIPDADAVAEVPAEPVTPEPSSATPEPVVAETTSSIVVGEAGTDPAEEPPLWNAQAPSTPAAPFTIPDNTVAGQEDPADEAPPLWGDPGIKTPAAEMAPLAAVAPESTATDGRLPGIAPAGEAVAPIGSQPPTIPGVPTPAGNGGLSGMETAETAIPNAGPSWNTAAAEPANVVASEGAPSVADASNPPAWMMPNSGTEAAPIPDALATPREVPSPVTGAVREPIYENSLRSGATAMEPRPLAGAVSPVSNVTETPISPTSAVEDGYYTVQPMDNFWAIAEKVYGTTGMYEALAHHNRQQYPDSNSLKPGDRVAVPPVAELEKLYPALCRSAVHREAADRRQEMSYTAVSQSRTGNTYVVQEGDNLFNIAKYELGKVSRWVEIYNLNRELLGAEFNYLTPGMTLAMPASRPAESVAERTTVPYR